jgi:hypothetical protein
MAAITEPVERLRKVGEAYVHFGTSHPFHYRMMFMTPPPVSQCTPEEAQAKGKGNPDHDAYSFLTWTVQQAMAAGVFRPELTDAELIAQTLWAAVHGVASLEIALGSQNMPWCPLNERTTAILDAVMNGLVRREGVDNATAG